MNEYYILMKQYPLLWFGSFFILGLFTLIFWKALTIEEDTK